MPPTATAAIAAITTAANTDAAPRSSPTRLDGRDCLSDDVDPRQDRRPSADPGHDSVTVAPEFNRSPGHSQSPGGGRGGLVSAGGEPGRLTGCVHTPHLQSDRADSGGTQHQYRHHAGDGQCGLHRAEAAIVQTRVDSARLMMLVSAPTIESPVTTL